MSEKEGKAVRAIVQLRLTTIEYRGLRGPMHYKINPDLNTVTISFPMGGKHDEYGGWSQVPEGKTIHIGLNYLVLIEEEE